nr:transcriptional regulator Spx [Bacilli bacterium]
DDIISTRSKVIKDNNIDIDSMKLNELMDFIIENPTILKRPIIVSDMELQVGYNVDDITLFLPKELRECQDCFTDEENCKYAKSIKFEDGVK